MCEVTMTFQQRIFRGLLLVLATAAVCSAFLTIVRPAYLNWGATADEQQRRLPGDQIVPAAESQTTRAITIKAPISRVWPWLAQLGQDRGGFYSFDLLENAVGCRMPTKDMLRPERQTCNLGDRLWMYPPNRAGGIGFATLREYEPGHALAFGTRMTGTTRFQPEDGSWSFVAIPIDAGTTRVIVRGRGAPRTSLGLLAFDRIIFEPMHFMMERRMLIGLRELVETGSRNRWSNHWQIAVWTGTAMFGVFYAFAVWRRPRWVMPLAAFILTAAVFQVLTLAQPPLVIGVVLFAAVGCLSLIRVAKDRDRIEAGGFAGGPP
jgi:hypothetical protein